MAGVPTANLAKRYEKKVSERFYRESLVARFTNRDISFTGVRTVVVSSIPTIPMHDYDRQGANDATTLIHRYGPPENLGMTNQELTITKDRSFTFVIDKADNMQTGVMKAGAALRRQIQEVVVPETDFHAMFVAAQKATAVGHNDSTTITADNAYQAILDAQEALGNANVPDTNRLLICSYKFYTHLMNSGKVILDSDIGQKTVFTGSLGDVDGARLYKAPASRLPAGCDFILFHAPKIIMPFQLQDYRIHENPPGISGWLVEGRVLYDAFVLDNDRAGMFYHGAALAQTEPVPDVSKYGRGGYVAIATANLPTNPKTAGLFELSNGAYVKTNDTTVTQNKTYYGHND